MFFRKRVRVFDIRYCNLSIISLRRPGCTVWQRNFIVFTNNFTRVVSAYIC